MPSRGNNERVKKSKQLTRRHKGAKNREGEVLSLLCDLRAFATLRETASSFHGLNHTFNAPVSLFAHINNAAISGQLSVIRKTKKEPKANCRGPPAGGRRGSRAKSHSPRRARRAQRQTGELFCALLFPNFFAACKGFLWNLESGILDAAIRPRCDLGALCGGSWLCFSSPRQKFRTEECST